MLFCAVFTRISVRFCGIGTPLTTLSCSVVWSPHTSWHTSRNQQRRKKLNLLSLDQRRVLFDVLFLYKALNDYIKFDLSTYVQFFSDSDRYPLRGKDECTLKKNYASTNTFKFSFFSRIVDMWNTLPLLVRQATTIASFKEGVREFLAGNVWGFYYYYYYFIDCFFLYISPYAFSHF